MLLKLHSLTDQQGRGEMVLVNSGAISTVHRIMRLNPRQEKGVDAGSRIRLCGRDDIHIDVHETAHEIWQMARNKDGFYRVDRRKPDGDAMEGSFVVIGGVQQDTTVGIYRQGAWEILPRDDK